MEDLFINKIVETEAQAEQIVEKAKETANKLIEECKYKSTVEKREIEKRYDDTLVREQEIIKKEFDESFDKSLEEMKNQAVELKAKSNENFEKALAILLSGESGDGNS